MTRADARRNHDRLLNAAGVAFAQHGVDASLNDIARRAGVGAATLYRHFPTRDALLEALLAGRYTDLAAQADELRTAEPREALVTWLCAFMTHLTTFRGLAAFARAALRDEESAISASCHAMHVAWFKLVAHARQHRAVRADLDPADLLRLANGIAFTTEDSPDRATEADRLLRLVLDGVRPRTDTSRTRP